MMTKKERDKKLAMAVDTLAVLSHPVRLSMLCALCERGEMRAGELVEAEASRASQSQVSQFLAQMRALGIVSARKTGQTVYYSIKSAHVRRIIDTLYACYCGGA